jgi:hypothetical protein
MKITNWIEYNKTFDKFVKDGLFNLGTIFEYEDLEFVVDELFGLNPLAKIFCEDNNVPEESFYESEIWDKWRKEKVFKRYYNGEISFPEKDGNYQIRYDEIQDRELYLKTWWQSIKRKYLVGSHDFIYDEQSYMDYGFKAETKIFRYKKILNINEIINNDN